MVIQIAAWLLRDIRARCLAVNLRHEALRAVLKPEAWTGSDPCLSEPSGILLLWEAFVSGPGHAKDVNGHGMNEHVQDAATAAVAFRDWWPTLSKSSSAVSAEDPIATIGAAALWSGWSQDIELLSHSPLVLWPIASVGREVAPDDPADNDIGEVEAMQALPSVLTVTCGDTHCVWFAHQKCQDHQENFRALLALVKTSPSRGRQCEADFDGGGVMQPVTLRAVSDRQLSWRGPSARGSRASLRTIAFRT
jgi:hypothetical protein